jgi:hypothetical protein
VVPEGDVRGAELLAGAGVWLTGVGPAQPPTMINPISTGIARFMGPSWQPVADVKL